MSAPLRPEVMEALVSDLIAHEGYSRHAYEDSEGYWTIGFGRLIDRAVGGGITKTEAMGLLANDIAGVVGDLDRNVLWWRGLPPSVRRALVRMCFNLGYPRLSGFKKTLAALEAGDFERAADEALDSVWAGQVGDRAQRIADLIRAGE